jgi:YesN/AraC family two-component response regulator
MKNTIQELKNISKKLKILYVEDNIEAQESTKLFLDSLFLEVIVGSDGEEGLELFNAHEFDLIMSDINMPKMDGLEMLKKIREVDKNIPFVILSAYSDADSIIKSIKLDIDGYVLKPIEFEQCITVLYKIVDKIKLQQEVKEYQDNLEQKIESLINERLK